MQSLAADAKSPAGNRIEFRDVALSYEGKAVLRDVNLTIEPGEVIGIVGGSGVGKTTLLNLAAGLLTPTSGEVLVGGAPPANRSSGSFGYLFQQPTLLPWLRVIDYVALPLMVRDRPNALLNPFNSLTDAEKTAVRAALARAKVAQIEHARPSELSGGMQTRVALARTIVSKPTLMLLDEPFNSLDERLRADIYTEIQAIIAEHAATTLVVTHNILEAALLSDRIILMAKPDPARAATIAFETRVVLPRPRGLHMVSEQGFLDAMNATREALFAG